MKPTRHFLAIPDFSPAELVALFDLAARMKRREYRERPLAGKTLGMIFAKSSTRTRVSFEVGAFQLGGHALFLSSRDIQLGRGEPIRDTARVLSRYLDGIMIRTFDHADVEELARYGSIPVINGLTDLLHPCQVLADLLTVRESLGGVGRQGGGLDRRRQQHGQQLDQRRRQPRLRAPAGLPEGYEPNAEILERNREKASDHGHRRPARGGARRPRRQHRRVGVDGPGGGAGAAGARLPGLHRGRRAHGARRPDAIFLHCLPAHRGEEVSEEVLEGPQSRVWDEAENRLHVQKALMATLMGGGHA